MNRSTKRGCVSAACVVFFTLAGCGQEATQALPGQTTMPAPLPKHHYAMRDGDEYGYEQAISPNEREGGQAASKLMMYRYLGRQGDTLQVMHRPDKKTRLVAECALPCQFAKVYSFYGDQFIGRETLKLQPGALLAYVFDDAAEGHLQQMRGEQRGEKVVYWVDGKRERLIISSAVNATP